MSKQRFPSDPVEETPEELKARREMSESTYERDMAFLRAQDEGRRSKDLQWTGSEF